MSSKQNSGTSKINYLSLVAAGIFLQIILLTSLFNGCVKSLSYDTYHHPRSADFFSIYEAGHQALLLKNIYNPEPEFRRVPFHSGYRYLPPAAFIIGIPFNIFPPHFAYFLWILIQIFLLIINIFLTFGLIEKKGEMFKERCMAVFIWTFFFPFNVEYHMGQFSFLMSSLLFWTYLMLRKNNFVRASIWWTLSILLKSFSILFVPIFLREKKVKLVGVVLLVVLLCSLPYYMIFPSGWERFRMLNLSVTIGMGGILYKGNLGSQMFLQYLLHPFLGEENILSIGPWSWNQLTLTVTFLSALSVIFALLVTFMKKNNLSIVFPLWILIFFLLFRDIWENQYVMILPAMVAIYFANIFSKKFFMVMFLILALPTAHIWIKDIPELQFSTFQNLIYYGPKPLAVFIIYLGLLYKSLRK